MYRHNRWLQAIDYEENSKSHLLFIDSKSFAFDPGFVQNHPVTSLAYPCEENQFQAVHARLLLGSYQRLTGRPLLSEAVDAVSAAKQVFQAPFPIVSHDAMADPVFNYGNRAALMLFGFSWDEFIALPSRLSAEPVNREARKKLLQEVAEKGFIDHYRGIRITKQGARFQISDAVVWNLHDEGDVYRGQAACIRQWRKL